VPQTKEQLRQAIEHQQLRVREQPHNKLHLTARHSRFGGSFKRQSEVRGAPTRRTAFFGDPLTASAPQL